MLPETVNAHVGRTLHPTFRDRTCGGSSGGEAVAVAPDMAYSAALYAEAETIPDLPQIHPWGRNAPEGANLAVETLASYVNLTGLALPPLRVESVVCDLATAVGCWDGDAISLVPGLSREQAFYVTLHEVVPPPPSAFWIARTLAALA